LRDGGSRVWTRLPAFVPANPASYFDSGLVCFRIFSCLRKVIANMFVARLKGIGSLAANFSNQSVQTSPFVRFQILCIVRLRGRALFKLDLDPWRLGVGEDFQREDTTSASGLTSGFSWLSPRLNDHRQVHAQGPAWAAISRSRNYLALRRVR